MTRRSLPNEQDSRRRRAFVAGAGCITVSFTGYSSAGCSSAEPASASPALPLYHPAATPAHDRAGQNCSQFRVSPEGCTPSLPAGNSRGEPRSSLCRLLPPAFLPPPQPPHNRPSHNPILVLLREKRQLLREVRNPLPVRRLGERVRHIRPPIAALRAVHIVEAADERFHVAVGVGLRRIGGRRRQLHRHVGILRKRRRLCH